MLTEKEKNENISIVMYFHEYHTVLLVDNFFLSFLLLPAVQTSTYLLCTASVNTVTSSIDERVLWLTGWMNHFLKSFKEHSF